MSNNTRTASSTDLSFEPFVMVAIAPEQLAAAVAGPLPVIAF
jgi:hypothetical protein